MLREARRVLGGHPALTTVRLREMQPVPIDEGAKGRRRIGPFWIEEGLGLVVAGALFLVMVAGLYVLAVALRPA